MTFTEPAFNDDVFIVIPIRSAKKSEPNRDPVVAEKRKTDRSKSIQDMHYTLVEKAKETRTVSFSGVSAMVDAVLRFSSITVKDQDKDLVNAAIENNNIEEIWKLISSETIDLQTALVSALERVSDSNTGVSIDCVSPPQDNVTMLRQLGG